MWTFDGQWAASEWSLPRRWYGTAGVWNGRARERLRPRHGGRCLVCLDARTTGPTVVVMTSNDSGVESSTDNDDCAQPMFQNRRLVSSAVDMSVMPVRNMRKSEEFPLSLCLNAVSDPIMFARPMLDEMPSRKLKCLFELANPAFPSTLDRFQSVSLYIYIYVTYGPTVWIHVSHLKTTGFWCKFKLLFLNAYFQK